MSWTIARLGSRFSLLFEPYRRRVMHSAVGRFLDQPMDLMVGLVEPDGTERVLPFSTRGSTLANPEQFERINSVTFRGYSERYNLRFEFNIHSVFYPQDEKLCTLPAIYLEMRVNPVEKVRWVRHTEPTPDNVRLFIRLRRPDTHLTTAAETDTEPARIDLAYSAALHPRTETEATHPTRQLAPAHDGAVAVRERIISLNRGCQPLPDGDGLTCQLPITEVGSGVKWRLVWAAHVADPVLQVQQDDGQLHDAAFRYNRHWANLDQVIHEAVETRDDALAHSRRFERLLEQAPLDPAQRHLLNQSFQNWLSNTFWCDVPQADGSTQPWFSVWEGACFFHSPIDVEYNNALLYLALWPELLRLQFQSWARHAQSHGPSGGAYLGHDLGQGCVAAGPAYPHDMPVEENANFLLLLQAYVHWVGDRAPAQQYRQLTENLARYLLWADREGSGFPTEGITNTIDDASPALQFARKQTYLGIKRVAGLRAASSLLSYADSEDLTRQCEDAAENAARQIESTTWLGDHYAVCAERSATGLINLWTGKPLPYETLPDWDAYSIYTANGLLLPTLIGQPFPLNQTRLRNDLANAARENRARYGCGNTSVDLENIRVSQNLWRDILARYLGMTAGLPAQHYWDMQVMSNTHDQSLGYVDTYIKNYLCFYPRGAVSMGYFLAGPRLMIDRLAAGGVYITINPDRDRPQRWPLLPLADWKAGKIPVCVVDDQGQVTIEGKIDPVVVHGNAPTSDTPAPNAGLIG